MMTTLLARLFTLLMTAESRVIEVASRDVLLVKRFDRERSADGYLRARMISALTLLRSEDNYQSRAIAPFCHDPARRSTHCTM